MRGEALLRCSRRMIKKDRESDIYLAVSLAIVQLFLWLFIHLSICLFINFIDLLFFWLYSLYMFCSIFHRFFFFFFRITIFLLFYLYVHSSCFTLIAPVISYSNIFSMPYFYRLHMLCCQCFTDFSSNTLCFTCAAVSIRFAILTLAIPWASLYVYLFICTAFIFFLSLVLP